MILGHTESVPQNTGPCCDEAQCCSRETSKAFLARVIDQKRTELAAMETFHQLLPDDVSPEFDGFLWTLMYSLKI